MDRTKVIELAREAGFQSPRLEDKTDYFMLDRFAALVAAHERQQCALSADDQWVRDPHVSGGDAIRARGELAKMAKPSNLT